MTCPPDPSRTFDDGAPFALPARDHATATTPTATTPTAATPRPAPTLPRRPSRTLGPRGPVSRHDQRLREADDAAVDGADPRAFILLAVASGLAALTVGVLSLVAWAA